MTNPARLTLVETPPAQAPPDGVSVSYEDDPKGRAKTLLQDLIYLAEDVYPELARHLAPAIKTLTAETKRTTSSTRAKIVHLLERAGGMTFEELHDDLLIPEADLWYFLNELIDAKHVEQGETGRRAPGSKANPNKGRTEYLFKLTDTSPWADSYTAPGPAASPTRAAMEALAGD